MRLQSRPRGLVVAALLTLAAPDTPVTAQNLARGQKWVASWAASAHGPYPSGNASAQPVLDFAIESPERGATDQTFRLIIRPDLWSTSARLRFTNTFGTHAITFDDVFIGLQAAAGNIVSGTNRRVTFLNGGNSLRLAAGESAFSDPIALGFVQRANLALLTGRKLAVSFHAVGSTGPMTWHAKALQTSYLSAPRSGSRGADDSDAAFPFTTTSWFFLDALDVMAPEETTVVACFGDSITDGTASTLNGDDRWPDVLSRRLHAAYGDRVSVVNAGIGGNRVTGPAASAASEPFAGGPSALDRLDRDVLRLSSLSAVIWLEGINDLSSGARVETILDGIKEGVKRMRAHPGRLRLVGATITPSLGSSSAAGTTEVDATRQAVNAFIRTGGLFDAVADFDAATRDPGTGELRAAFQPNSTIGGAGDRLHPNRAGYQAMANAVDLTLFAPRTRQP
jgi:lysophospholipase L1-like esterase